jgi:dTDP-4-dehydrorhamnose reductase
MMKTIIVTGGSGMIGSSLIKYLGKHKKYNLISLYREDPTDFDFCKNIKTDITEKKEVLELRKFKPDLIIHCAALTNIEFCEKNPELAYKINVEGTKNIAELSKICNSKIIYLSTDAVFDGKTGNYDEKSKTNPLNVYGKTKLEGENICLKNGKQNLVIRTNVFGKNIFIKKLSFVESIINSLSQGKEYTAFYDSIFSPISLDYLSEALIELYEKNASGIFHAAGSDTLNKFEFAGLIAEIFGFNKNLVKKISIEAVCTNVKRAKDTSMNNSHMLEFLDRKKTPSIREMTEEFRKMHFAQ